MNGGNVQGGYSLFTTAYAAGSFPYAKFLPGW